jgi:murein DD-endopeptidase MepM/ murein hydrolase activator NlpD
MKRLPPVPARLRLLCGLSLLAALASACNYPGAVAPSLSAAELRQTLAAASGAATGAAPPAAAASQAPVLTPADTVSSPPPAASPTFPALPTAEPPTQAPPGSGPYVIYYARPGDTLLAVAGRFAQPPERISADGPLPSGGYLPPGLALTLPYTLGEATRADLLLPDEALVNGPPSAGFDAAAFAVEAGGYLGRYAEELDGRVLHGGKVIERVAAEFSVSPRLLLALLEYRSGWVYGQPASRDDVDYPLGFRAGGSKGLYKELSLAASRLNTGYYGWRGGSLTDLSFFGGQTRRLHPALNPGSVGLMNLFAWFKDPAGWDEALYTPGSFLEVYRRMFGDPWQAALGAAPLLPADLLQPEFQLPFNAGERWSLTGGPHPAWNNGTPRAALDFSPVDGRGVCAVSSLWAAAVAPGVVAYADFNRLALDLDGDGREQTGWVLVYLHLASAGLVPAGTTVSAGDPLGHPSCEGGLNPTGKHMHIARKYNGEWLAADGPVPMALDGWLVIAGERNYQGRLVRGEQVVIANPGGPRTSIIER